MAAVVFLVIVLAAASSGAVFKPGFFQWCFAQAGGNAAALGYRGCLSRDPVAPIFTITVAWGGTTPGEPDTVPNSDCGEGQFGDDAYRRVLRTTVRIPSLAE